MSDHDVVTLKAVYPGLQVMHEGEESFILLPSLALPEGCKPSHCNALLCPHARDGYATRLYFAEKINTPTNRNWNGAFILEQNWHAISWKDVTADQTLTSILLEHLVALR